MRKILEGMIFDTDKSRLIGSRFEESAYQNQWPSEGLYKTKSSIFFLAGESNSGQYGEAGMIYRITQDEAIAWANETLKVLTKTRLKLLKKLDFICTRV